MINYQNKVLVLFGNSQHSFEKIKSSYPDFTFCKVKQTHSDIVVESTQEPVTADSHYTDKINRALLISTADCMPIMLYCRQTHRIAAIHAGWKGVANKITEKTINQLVASGSTDRDFIFWIGPHILQDSFEVDSSTFEILEKAQYRLSFKDYAYTKNDKYYVALIRIVVSQIENTIGSKAKIEFLNIDTKTNSDYYSYRRDRTTSERNLSFICLLN